MANADWTADEDKLLDRLWAEGLSAAQIERRFAGSRSRNAIIGRANRRNLTPRTRSTQDAAGKRQRAARRYLDGRTPPPTTAPSLTPDPSLAADLVPTFFDLPLSEWLTFEQMPVDGCRWTVDSLFCPNKKTHGFYCAHHHSIAHGKQASATKRKLSSLLEHRW
jgi:hypothetical protein